MKIDCLSKILAPAILLIAATVSLFADEGDKEVQAKEAELVKKLKHADLFVEDRITTQFVTGVLFSGVAGPKIDTFNYEQSNLRLGWMLNTPGEDAPWRGNVEAIVELSGSGVFSDYGSVVIGPTFLVRYNFVQPGWWAVPYIQGGAGVVYTDAYEEANQRAIGQAFEFTPQVSGGVRFFVADNWSFDVECMFHHISNASIANRNLGVNALGGFVGFTYFFDKLWTE